MKHDVKNDHMEWASNGNM